MCVCVKRMHMDGKVLVAPSFDQGIQKTFPGQALPAADATEDEEKAWAPLGQG